MPKPSRPEQIRHLISDTLVTLGARPDVKQRETLLIKNGNYCGHRIKHGDFHAVWFVEEDEVKFFGPNGLLKMIHPSVALQTAGEEHRTAA